MKKRLVKLIVATPFYPHWIEFRQLRVLRIKLISMLHGEVIEVGAGASTLKLEALAANNKISQYTATDYSSWDNGFAEGEATQV